MNRIWRISSKRIGSENCVNSEQERHSGISCKLPSFLSESTHIPEPEMITRQARKTRMKMEAKVKRGTATATAVKRLWIHKGQTVTVPWHQI
eukprot:scaffold8661_cov78-Skeletonema_dohrnii-CCMP3373.AAC.4